MSSRRLRCAVCHRAVVRAVVWHEDAELGGREGGRWLHAADAITSPWQPGIVRDHRPQPEPVPR